LRIRVIDNTSAVLFEGLNHGGWVSWLSLIRSTVGSKFAPESSESIGLSSFSHYFMAINWRGPSHISGTNWLLACPESGGVDWYTLLSTGVSRAVKQGALAVWALEKKMNQLDEL
jgi:hypothetical protein